MRNVASYKPSSLRQHGTLCSCGLFFAWRAKNNPQEAKSVGCAQYNTNSNSGLVLREAARASCLSQNTSCTRVNASRCGKSHREANAHLAVQYERLSARH